MRNGEEGVDVLYLRQRVKWRTVSIFDSSMVTGSLVDLG
jgi:hypothetical protein